MSTEEQDQLLGKLLRESKESDRLLAALREKTADYAKRLREAVYVLEGLRPLPSGNMPCAYDATVLASLPTKDEIIQTAAERESEKTRNADLKARVETFQ
jgi:hypothetical protein